MVKFFLVAAAVLLAAAFGVRKISKLPSRYDRKPRHVNSWSALDQGIDPTSSEHVDQ
jgi:hypothetical protein